MGGLVLDVVLLVLGVPFGFTPDAVYKGPRVQKSFEFGQS